MPLIVAGDGIARWRAVATRPPATSTCYPFVFECVGAPVPEDDATSRRLAGRARGRRAARSRRDHRIPRDRRRPPAASCCATARSSTCTTSPYPPQLFDLAKDPEELVDVAGDPAYADVLERCRATTARDARPAGSRRARPAQAARLARTRRWPRGCAGARRPWIHARPGHARPDGLTEETHDRIRGLGVFGCIAHARQRRRANPQPSADHRRHQPVALVRRLQQDRRGLREGDRQQGRARRQSVRRQRREAAQLGAREGRDLRHPDHQLHLSRRDSSTAASSRRSTTSTRRSSSTRSSISYDDTAYWDAEDQAPQRDHRRAVRLPINGNIQVLYYRADLYEKAGSRCRRRGTSSPRMPRS